MLMRHIIKIGAILTIFCTTACGPSQNHYPSYKQTAAKYAPKEKFEGVRIDDPEAFPRSRCCNCPRIWYNDHWVYYYHDRWFYWEHDHWHYYPRFHFYYYHEFPYIYSGPERSITKGSPVRNRKRRSRIKARPISKDSTHKKH